MEPYKIVPSSKPHPPVVGKVTHHSIELYWDLEKKEKRQGPQEQWLRFSIEEEDPKMHNYGVIYTMYSPYKKGKKSCQGSLLSTDWSATRLRDRPEKRANPDCWARHVMCRVSEDETFIYLVGDSQ
uniref:Fibronectin type 3 and ankyrin repeat domains 1 n=1 Tax=Peromyscus maniculatus bairdii TaxID=230844 RepID=A0A8C8W6M7_PERMB